MTLEREKEFIAFEHENLRMENHNGTFTSTTATSSLSKQAIVILNATNGLLAHPAHHHSFTAVGSSSLFAPAAGVSLLSTPKCYLAGAFRKCAACRARLGRRPHPTTDTKLLEREDEASVSVSSSGMEMLYCVACGVYAHRSCAFGRRQPRLDRHLDNGGDDDDAIISMPGCVVNRPIIEAALGLSRNENEQLLTEEEEEQKSDSHKRCKHPYWPFFGSSADDDEHNSRGNKEIMDATMLDESTVDNDRIIEKAVDEGDNDKQMIVPTQTNASWSIFSRSRREETMMNDKVENNTAIDKSTQQRQAIHQDDDTANDKQPCDDPIESKNSPKESNSSTWYFFRANKGNEEVENVSNNTEKADDSSSEVMNDSARIIHDKHSISSPRSEGPVMSWSIFRRTPSTADETNNPAITIGATENTDESTTGNQTNTDVFLKEDDDLCRSALEDILTSDHDTATAEDETIKQPLDAMPPPRGAFRSSIDIIRKTTETASNVPKAYSIGMVAGGVAGLAIAGPAG